MGSCPPRCRAGRQLRKTHLGEHYPQGSVVTPRHHRRDCRRAGWCCTAHGVRVLHPGCMAADRSAAPNAGHAHPLHRGGLWISIKSERGQLIGVPVPQLSDSGGFQPPGHRETLPVSTLRCPEFEGSMNARSCRARRRRPRATARSAAGPESSTLRHSCALAVIVIATL